MSTTMAPTNGSGSKQLTIRERLNSQAMLAEFGRVLPKVCTPERFVRVALTALTRTPKLAECDQASFFRCLLDLAQWGLEPDGRRAHLIPFNNRKRDCVECQLIIDYKGLVELAYRSGGVKAIHADVVRTGDLFRYALGQVVEHVPHFLRKDPDRPEKSGDVMAAYCVATMAEGVTKCEILSVEEINGIRRRSRAGGDGPWVTDWAEMAKKTAFRRLSKWLPLSAEIHAALDGDDDQLQPMVRVQAPTMQGLEDLTRQLESTGTVALESREDSPSATESPSSENSQESATKVTIEQFIAGLEAFNTLGETTHHYDSHFGPESKHSWEPGDDAKASAAVKARQDAIRAARSAKA